MDASFKPIEIVPSKTPFGLDQLRRSYKTALDAASAIAAAPAVGTADETFGNMFLMPISTPESAESATRIDLVYMGIFGGGGGSVTVNAPGINYAPGDSLDIVSGGEGATIFVDSVGTGNGVVSFHVASNTFTVAHTALAATSGTGIGSGATFDVVPAIPFVMPAAKHDIETAVQSASSSWGSSGAIIGSVSIQFYAPANVLTYFSQGGTGTTEAADPTSAPVIITTTVGSGSFGPGTTMAIIATSYFSTQIVHTLNATEIVPGQYWQNVSRKTKVFVPFQVTIPAGTSLISLAAPGSGYSVGETLSISGTGGSATLVITALGLSQSVLAFNTTSNTFTTAQTLLPSTGSAGGSGALFNVIIV